MNRRCKVLPIGVNMMAVIFSPGLHLYDVVENGLPPDALVVAVNYDAITQGPVRLLIASESFDNVPEGEPWPEIGIRIADAKINELIVDRWKEIR